MQRPDHALLPIYRRDIYTAIGPGSDMRSYRARGWLDIVATRHVMHVWQRMWPDDNLPEYMLRVAEDIILGSIDIQTASREWEAAWHATAGSDDERKWQANEEACCARQAAMQAVCWLIDPTPNCNDPESDDTDWDALHPVCSDTAMWAAAACAGPVWVATSDPERRRVFWEWWLKEAIPHALERALVDS